jgi:glycosyltransferase involved in cell wall biosynthesis
MGEKEPKVSVIIPTYNRKDYLIKCLSYIEKQNTNFKFEVIIVDDGSTDNTKSVVNTFSKNSRLDIKHDNQKNSGPAKARNLGIKHSRGEYILFLGDDIYIEDPNFLNNHMNFIEKYGNCASLGFTDWTKEYKNDKFMRVLCPKGAQFNYSNFKIGEICSWPMFYTCNIMIKKTWFENELFDENFPYAAYEDIELGYRLFKKGLKIRFNPEAIAYHDHYYYFDSFIKRQNNVGKSLKYFLKKWPELKSQLMPKKVTIKRIIVNLTNLAPFLSKIDKIYNYRIKSLLSLEILRSYNEG